MDVHGQLISAQLENKATAPTLGVPGRVYWDTASLIAKIYNGTAWVGLGGSVPTGVKWRLYGDGPIEETVEGIELLKYAAEGEQNAYALLKVPTDYAAGTQIKLIGGLLACANGGKACIRARAQLVKAGTTTIGALAAHYTSTNTAVDLPSTVNQVKAIGDIDITNSSGQINSVAVAAGDAILVRLFREFAAESPTSPIEEIKVLRDSFVPKFTL